MFLQRHRVVLLLAAASVLSLLCAPARAQDTPTRIGVINAAKVFAELQETKDLQQKMDNEAAALQTLDSQKQQAVLAKKSARDQIKPDSPQYQVRSDEYSKAEIEYRIWKETNLAQRQRDRKMQAKVLFDKIMAATAEVAKQRNIDLVLADQTTELPDLEELNYNQLRQLLAQRNIAFASSRLDLNSDVIAMLDARYKNAGSASQPR